MANWSFSIWRRQFLERGESGVALLGVTMALILICCVSANVWLTDRENHDSLVDTKITELKGIGPVLADNCRQFISAGDLPALHRLVTNSAVKLKLSEFSVSLGQGRLLADINPSRINVRTLPDHWTLGSSDLATPNGRATSLRFPFAVAGRGAGYIQIGNLPAEGESFAISGSAGLICACGLCLLIFVYRRSRRNLAQMDVVQASLAAIGRGETAISALLVDAGLGTAAVAWNTLLTEIDELRKRSKSMAAATSNGNRRGGTNNLEAACDAMSQGLILVDEKMHVRFANGAACSFLKHERGSLAGTPAVDLVTDPKFHEAIVDIAAGKLRRPLTVEIEQSGEAGNGVLRLCIRPVRRGDADSAMIIIEDITQQRTAERARNTFINQVTHELRTPLTNIRLYAETAIEDGETNPEVRANCLNVINQESRRLERIVTEMLSVAEIEAGSTMIRKDEVYFDVIMNDLRTDYQAQAQDKKITLDFAVSPKLPKLEADKDKLTIAMHNLIGNALKYTPEGGKVTVTVDVRDGQLAIDVADTGIGIKPEEAEKIFDRFFRSADPRVGKIVGTGLGLTLAREVMRLHGGDVTVQSELNRGSTFTATMPALNAAA